LYRKSYLGAATAAAEKKPDHYQKTIEQLVQMHNILQNNLG
jgi:hypothetical protein